jgi:hypothetical protein
MSFSAHANIALLRHVLSASERGIDYAPDNGGPHTVYIARILHETAQAWAVGRKADYDDNVPVDGKASFIEAMKLADDRIRQYCAANKLARAA